MSQPSLPFPSTHLASAECQMPRWAWATLGLPALHRQSPVPGLLHHLYHLTSCNHLLFTNTTLGQTVVYPFHLHHPYVTPRGRNQLAYCVSGPLLPHMMKCTQRPSKLVLKAHKPLGLLRFPAQAGCVCNVTKSRYDG